MELGCAREGYFSCSPLVRVELARVPVPLGIFAIFQQTMGARVLGTVLAVDIVVVGERYKCDSCGRSMHGEAVLRELFLTGRGFAYGTIDGIGLLTIVYSYVKGRGNYFSVGFWKGSFH